MPEPKSRGILLIDKPEGISSFGVIRELRKITGIKKIGHTGTLDPFASGLLICLVGSYTRLAAIGESEDKSYLATVQLGSRTSTGDTEGEVIETSSTQPSTARLRDLSEKVLELDALPVPAFSAIKIKGKRAYQYARQEIEVKMPVRPTKISSFSFIHDPDGQIINSQNQLTYRCTVSKGTYIRSLSEWLATELGTLGHTIALRRESIGKFNLAQATSLNALTHENWSSFTVSYQHLLHRYQFINLNPQQEQLVRNGNPIIIEAPIQHPETPVALVSTDGDLLALATCTGTELKPYLVLA